MAKGLPNIAVGYGPRTGVVTTPGAPVNPVGSAGSQLVKDIRGSKGWGK